jgi:hypothetical protein
MKTSERLGDLTDMVLWWPLYLVDKMKPGPLKFVVFVAVLPMAIPCTLTALPLMLITFFVEVWEDANG